MMGARRGIFFDSDKWVRKIKSQMSIIILVVVVVTRSCAICLLARQKTNKHIWQNFCVEGFMTGAWWNPSSATWTTMLSGCKFPRGNIVLCHRQSFCGSRLFSDFFFSPICVDIHYFCWMRTCIFPHRRSERSSEWHPFGLQHLAGWKRRRVPPRLKKRHLRRRILIFIFLFVLNGLPPSCTSFSTWVIKTPNFPTRGNKSNEISKGSDGNDRDARSK